MKKDNEYNELLISLFSYLVDIYDVKTAIVILYKINELRGIRI